MDEFFYGTLPQDTQDFSQVLRGVGRSIGDIGRGVSYYPYDLVGAPVDLINMALTPVGLGSEQPVLGSDYLRNIAQSLGFAQPSTGSGAETAARFGAAFVNPAAGARAVGQASDLVTRGANLSADRLVQMITGNPQATAPRVLEETSMPFMQAVAPKTPAVPGLMEPAKSDIGFYSQLEAATIPLQNKGTGDQYLAQIQKSAGVKPEEIQWTGLDEFLKGKKSVTKTEIQDYLNANKVDVREVRLDRSLPVVQAERRGAFEAYDRGEITLEQRNAILERSEPVNTRHHLGAYQGIKTEIPGGENYREILLTLPFKEPKMPKGYEVSSMQYDDGTVRYFAETPTTRSAGYKTEAEAQSELQRMTEGLKDWRASQASYRSTHFDQPNILAHMRVNDRVVDGKKTLFIEEIQSDWHQAGRKKGYATPEAKERQKEIDLELDELRAKRLVLNDYLSNVERQDKNYMFNEDYLESTRELQDIRNRISALNDEAVQKVGIPDAPFKTSWHELTLKRAIQEASEKGYDQIAFTTGKTQAERYDLSKQVDHIDYRLAGFGENARYELGVVGKNGQEIDLPKPFYTAEELPDVVGKEVADKIISGQGQGGGGRMTLRGVDLQIGGEGMKGFYDNILPKSLEKLGKKFDAKVGKTEMDGVEVWQMDITPKMRESVTTKGQPLFAVPAIGAGLLGAGMYQDEQMF